MNEEEKNYLQYARDEIIYRIQIRYNDQIVNSPKSDVEIKGNLCYNFLQSFCFTTLQTLIYKLCESIYSLKHEKITETISKTIKQIHPLIANPSLINRYTIEH